MVMVALTNKTAIEATMVSNNNTKTNGILATVWHQADTILVEGLTALTVVVNKAKVIKTPLNSNTFNLGVLPLSMKRTARQRCASLPLKMGTSRGRTIALSMTSSTLEREVYRHQNPHEGEDQTQAPRLHPH